MTYYGRAGFAARREKARHEKAPPVGPVAQRRAWLPVMEAARRCAADPQSPARDLAEALHGLTPATFPLEVGDVRRGAVSAFHALASFWTQASEVSRTPFAPGLSGLTEGLDRILHDIGAELARQGLARRGMAEDD